MLFAVIHNAESVVTPYAQSWTGEKYHTLTHDGPMDESHKRRVSEELQARAPAAAEEYISSRLRKTRLMTAAIKATGIDRMLIESTQDDVNLEQLRAFVQQIKSGDAPPEGYRARRPARGGNGSPRACEDPPVLEINEPVHPLRRIGRSHYFGINAGLVVAHYDAEARILDFHLEMTQSARLYPYEPTPPKNGLWLGSNDGATAPEDFDGRSDQFYLDDVDFNYAFNELF